MKWMIKWPNDRWLNDQMQSAILIIHEVSLTSKARRNPKNLEFFQRNFRSLYSDLIYINKQVI